MILSPYEYRSTAIEACLSDYTRCKLLDLVTDPCPNINYGLAETPAILLRWICNHIRFGMHNIDKFETNGV